MLEGLQGGAFLARQDQAKPLIPVRCFGMINYPPALKAYIALGLAPLVDSSTRGCDSYFRQGTAPAMEAAWQKAGHVGGVFFMELVYSEENEKTVQKHLQHFLHCWAKAVGNWGTTNLSEEL